tara:strand:+ start:177 stop:821 length:645 start_codon:yes stop_codon:yes gene_type:complete
MVNYTYCFDTFNDFTNALYKIREYMRSRGWNDKPKLSPLQWGDWLGNKTPYIQLEQNFYDNQRDYFEITIRRLTHVMASGECNDIHDIALRCKAHMIYDSTDRKMPIENRLPLGFVQQTLTSWIDKQRLCVCCGSKWDCDFGHNPAPACDYGRCCDDCNQTVISIRFHEAGFKMDLDFSNAPDSVSDAEIKKDLQSDDFKRCICYLMEQQLKKR